VKRSYDMTVRGRQAALTTDRIVSATEALLRRLPVGEVTLEAVARDAGVSVQTVLRHLGSRQGCLDAAGARVMARVEAQRGSAGRGHGDAGSVEDALAELVAHYEAEGRLVLHLLAQETVEPFARSAVETGRAYHRAWVLRGFGTRVDPGDADTVDALVAATDLYLWKLLRLDLGRSPGAVVRVMKRLVHGILENPCAPS
jgi:AcrR family transcriptional regulator